MGLEALALIAWVGFAVLPAPNDDLGDEARLCRRASKMETNRVGMMEHRLSCRDDHEILAFRTFLSGSREHSGDASDAQKGCGLLAWLTRRDERVDRHQNWSDSDSHDP